MAKTKKSTIRTKKSAKRYFKIYTGRYGGELTVGTISKEFVEYWQPKLEDGDSELIETLQRYEYEDDDMGDPDSPIPKEDYNAWHDCDDLEHVTGPFSDNQYSWVEVKLHTDAVYSDGLVQWKEGKEHGYEVQMYEEIGDESDVHDYNVYVYGREAYTNNIDECVEPIPVLQFFSSEKGNFGEVVVETNGEDFDPEKLQIGVVETDLATIIEQYWYDRKPLQVDFNYSDTYGKGYYATVGFMNPAWHDTSDLYITYDQSETDRVKESFNDMYEDA